MRMAHKNSTTAANVDEKMATNETEKMNTSKNAMESGRERETRSGKSQKVKTIKYYVLVRFQTGTLFMCARVCELCVNVAFFS